MPIQRRAVFLAGLALASPVRAQAAPEILARFPNGTFLENLVVLPNGDVLFTNYFARALERWSPAAGQSRFAEVPAHPVSLTALPEGRFALVVHGAPFNGGPAAMRGQAAVLIIAPDGGVAQRIAMPDSIFPNGAILLAPNLLLVADSALGRIWALDLATGENRVWLEHPTLAPVAGRPSPGVNGLKRMGDGLMISNSAQRLLLRVALTGTEAAGAPAPVAQMTTGVDDFAVAPDGTIYAATHAHGLAALPPGAATPRAIPAPGLEGSTAVALTPDSRGLFALGTGGLFEGGRGEAVLARVALGPV